MNVETTGADFRRAMTIAGKIVDRRSVIPILQTLRCRANGKLEITGTDLDIEVKASVSRVPGRDAAFVIKAPKQVAASVAGAGGETVSMKSEAKHVTVTSGALSLEVGALAAEDWPDQFDRPLEPTFTATLSAEHLKAFGRIACAISTEETRYYLNGINLKRMPTGLFRAAATDGHRLCLMDIALPDAVGDVGDIIIPRRLLSLLRDLGGKVTDGIKLTVGPQAARNSDGDLAPDRKGLPRLHVAFDSGTAAVSMTGKLIDGTFPDVDRVVPRANDKQAVFAVADLQRALRCVSGYSKHIRAVKLSLVTGGATLSSLYLKQDVAATATLPCEHRHTGFAIGFNGRYLSELIAAAGGDEVVLSFSDTSGPVLMRNPADTEWTGILMPMRVD